MTNRIRHIVRLSQMLKQWRRKASLSSSKIAGDDFVPSDVPPGHVAVTVGISGRRYVIRAKYLNHPAFRNLLREAEEEYGFDNNGGPLYIPCDESDFEDALKLATSHGDDSSLSRCRVTESAPLLRSGGVTRCRA